MSTDTLEREELPPFSSQIWAGTSSNHGSAEGSGFMSELISGTLPLERYIAMHRQMYFLYSCLEDAVDGLADEPTIAPFADERLRRARSLERDLLALTGESPANRANAQALAICEPTAATSAYCDAIRSAAEQWPPGLVAHHYTRYLGDLSGGQHIRRVVERTYGIDASSGSAFYHFDAIDDLVSYKKDYRSALDSMNLDAPERERFIREVNRSYELSTALANGL